MGGRLGSRLAPHRVAPLWIVFVLTALGCGERPATSESTAAQVVFTRDIAPILHANCVACHQPEGPAPFSLLTWDEARRHAVQMAWVTRSRFMPPWLPARGEHRFVGERGLDDSEIELIDRWAKAGAPRGDPRDEPSRPKLRDGWLLGEPDLVVTMAEDYLLPADGPDVFRNFVIRPPLEATRWVRQIELRPGPPRAVHHAIVRVDRTPASRVLDAETAEPGFPGMEMGGATPPSGHFIGWAPGRVPLPGDPDLAWRLHRDADLVVQLHMLPTGKPERIRPSIGLHFADRPPRREPSIVILRSDAIDIAPGVTDFTIRDRFQFPVEVWLLGLHPHAHYLAREMRVAAELPGSERIELLHIPDWNFNWQDEYRYVEPVRLPAGTTVIMTYAYDNSSGNPHNPSDPPVRVRAGDASTDEMGTLLLQVMTETPQAALLLAEAAGVHALEKRPDDWLALNSLAHALMGQRRVDEAIERLRQALAARPQFVHAHFNLGAALMETSRHAEAIESFRAALAIDANFARAYSGLGHAWLTLGRSQEGLAALRRALALDPSLAEAHYNLGVALLSLGSWPEAIDALRVAVRLEPDDAMAHSNLGAGLQSAGRGVEASAAYLRALELEPRLAQAHNNLGRLLMDQGDLEGAAMRFRRAIESDPSLIVAHVNLGDLLVARGESEAAARSYRRALELDPDDAQAQRGLTALAAR